MATLSRKLKQRTEETITHVSYDLHSPKCKFSQCNRFDNAITSYALINVQVFPTDADHRR